MLYLDISSPSAECLYLNMKKLTPELRLATLLTRIRIVLFHHSDLPKGYIIITAAVAIAAAMGAKPPLKRTLSTFTVCIYSITTQPYRWCQVALPIIGLTLISK